MFESQMAGPLSPKILANDIKLTDTYQHTSQVSIPCCVTMSEAK